MAEAETVDECGPAFTAAAASKRARAALATDPDVAKKLIKEAEGLEQIVSNLQVIKDSPGIPSKQDMIEASLPGKGPGDVEQAMTFSDVDDVKLPVEGLPDRQAVSMETAKYSQGMTDIMAMLLPLLALAGSVWQTLGGFGQIISMFDSMTAASTPPTGPLTGDAKKAEDAKFAIKVAIEDAGYTMEDLNDPLKSKEIAKNVEIPPTPGLSSSAMSIDNFMDRVMPVMPCVAVPNDPNVKSDLPKGSGVKQVIETVPKQIPGLVDSSADSPPDCTLVNTNQFRSDSNIFKAIGNPAAALQEDISLAQDLNNVAGQHQNLAAAMTNISDAAKKFAEDEFTESLRLSIRALIKGLCTYNFQTDETGSFASSTARSLKWWNAFTPPPQTLDPTIMEKINNGETLLPGDITAYNNAIVDLVTASDIAASPETRFGSMPGTLVHAAIGNDPYAGTLDELVDDIPALVATREGIGGGGVATIQAVIFDLGQIDARVLEIPIIIMGADPRIQTYTTPVQRWILSMKYILALTPAERIALQLVETDISTTSLLFIEQVRASTVDFDTLYLALLQHKVPFEQKQDLDALTAAWDILNSVLVIEPLQQSPEAVMFLTELLATRPLLPGSESLTYAIEQLVESTLAIGGPLGSDLAQLCGVVGALLRCDMVLKSLTIVDEDKEERVKELLEHADEMAKPVEILPNREIFLNISEVI